MKFKGLWFIAIAMSGICLAAEARQAGQEFVDQEGKFKLLLVADWRAVSYSDAVGRRRTEFINRDRSEGLLKVTREKLSGSVAETAEQDEESLRVYRGGFESAAKESFSGGTLSGTRLSFYFTESSRKLAGVNYYLQDGNSVWVLRFAGRRGSLDMLRNQTDQIARSFRSL